MVLLVLIIWLWWSLWLNLFLELLQLELHIFLALSSLVHQECFSLQILPCHGITVPCIHDHCCSIGVLLLGWTGDSLLGRSWHQVLLMWTLEYCTWLLWEQLLARHGIIGGSHARCGVNYEPTHLGLSRSAVMQTWLLQIHVGWLLYFGRL